TLYLSAPIHARESHIDARLVVLDLPSRDLRHQPDTATASFELMSLMRAGWCRALSGAVSEKIAGARFRNSIVGRGGGAPPSGVLWAAPTWCWRGLPKPRSGECASSRNGSEKSSGVRHTRCSTIHRQSCERPRSRGGGGDATAASTRCLPD